MIILHMTEAFDEPDHILTCLKTQSLYSLTYTLSPIGPSCTHTQASYLTHTCMHALSSLSLIHSHSNSLFRRDREVWRPTKKQQLHHFENLLLFKSSLDDFLTLKRSAEGVPGLLAARSARLRAQTRA